MNAKRAFTGATHIVYDVLASLSQPRRMSICQIMAQTGYSSDKTIRSAVLNLEADGVIKRYSDGPGKPYTYELIR
jgi:hypothetical protein